MTNTIKKLLHLPKSTKTISLLPLILILLEIGNALSRIARNEAMTIIRYFQTTSNVMVLSLTSELMDNALNLYTSHQDKTWGLVDCISFIVMQERNISIALSFDRHFLQAGFTLAQP